MHAKLLFVKTPKHKLTIEYDHAFVQSKDVIVKKTLFEKMCLQGCSNYNNKYSCPALSPNFKEYTKEHDKLFILMMSMNLNQLLDYKEYLKLQLGNSVLKSQVEKLMRSLEKKYNTKFLSTGSCRLCKPCKKKNSLPCKHPTKMRFSLEALGVDCDYLTTTLFNKPLLWYKNKKAPTYTLVVCALPLKTSIDEKEVILAAENLLAKTL
ncbi:hypothetical protein GOV04_05965 [Candidatus Woesearchaeota archaeon]|nr:hypothetical protein [Candidatus Woesearchaeota archaeon]